MPTRIPITDFEAPELDPYARMTEAQLLHAGEPAGGLFLAESPKVILRALEAGCEAVSFWMLDREANEEEKRILEAAGEIPVFVSPLSTMLSLTGFPMTRGMLALMRRPPLPDVRDLLAGKKRVAILENVMNPTNIGAVFRSAAAMFVDAVILTGGCSDPLFRRASRVSMGCVFQIPWTKLSKRQGVWPEETLALLKKSGFLTAAMALREETLDLGAPYLSRAEKLALIFGTEGYGLSAGTIAGCDATVRIPMSGGVDSLNVAAASAVAFWETRPR